MLTADDTDERRLKPFAFICGNLRHLWFSPADNLGSTPCLEAPWGPSAVVWTFPWRDCLSQFDRRPIIPPSGPLACGDGLNKTALRSSGTVVCISLDVVWLHLLNQSDLVEQDNLFDEAFLGTWEAEQEAKFEFRRFEVIRSGPEERSYRAVLRNEAGEKQEPSFQLFLSQIDGKKFITAKFEKPGSEKASPDTPAAAAIYLTFAMDRCEDGELSVRYLRADWLAGQVKKNPSILKHAWIPRPGNREKSDLRLTAPTDELRTFVLGQLDKREAWMPVIFKKIL